MQTRGPEIPVAMSIRIIPTRNDESLAALHAINSCFLKTGARAFAALKRRIEVDSSRFRYIGDFLVSESQFFRKYADYSLHRKFVPDPYKNQGPYIVLISADTHAWHHVDDSLEDYLGYTLQELENDWITAYHPDSYEETDENLTSIMRKMHMGECNYAEVDVHYQAKIGYSVWSQLTFSVVNDWKGTPEYFMTVIRDITLAKWAEQLYTELEGLINLVEMAGLYDASVTALDGLLRHYDGEQVDHQVMNSIKALLNTQI